MLSRIDTQHSHNVPGTQFHLANETPASRTESSAEKTPNATPRKQSKHLESLSEKKANDRAPRARSHMTTEKPAEAAANRATRASKTNQRIPGDAVAEAIDGLLFTTNNGEKVQHARFDLTNEKLS